MYTMMQMCIRDRNTLIRPGFQLSIMLTRQPISCQRQVIVFIDQSYIQTSRTGLTMVAVNADSLRLLRGKRTQHRVIPFFRRRVTEAQQAFKIAASTDTGQDSQYARFVQRILYALEFRQCLPKRRALCVQKLASAERLHYRDAHALLLTCLLYTSRCV